MDVRRLTRAIEDVVAEQGALRTHCFEYEGRVFLRVHDRTRIQLHTLDLGPDAEADQEDRLREVSNGFFRKPFRLTSASACRFMLVRLSDTSHVLLCVFHLILFDDDSERIFLRKLAEAYAGSSTVPGMTPPSQAEEDMTLTGLREDEYLVSERWEEDLSHWQDALRNRTAPITWPLVHKNTGQSPRQPLRTGYRRFTLQPSLSRSIDAFCGQHDIEKGIFYLTAFCALLQRHLGNTGLALGVSMGADPAREDRRGIGMGRFHLPLGIGLDGSASFLDLARHVSSALTENHTRHHTSYAVMATRIDEAGTGKTAFPGILFRCATDPLEGIHLEGLELSPFELRPEAETSDLSVTLAWKVVGTPGQRLEFQYRYDMSQLSKSCVSQLHGRWELLLQACIGEPHAATGTYQILPPREWRKVVQEWNATGVEDMPQDTLQDTFRRQAGMTPDRVAVVSEAGEMSYRQLDEASERIARRLIAAGIRYDEPVGMFMGRSLAMMTTIMGILKTGAGMMPIEVYQPPDRVALMLSDSGVRHLVCDGRTPEVIPDGIRVLQVADLSSISDDLPSHMCLPKGRPEGLAYVLYTSGSTGKPKGVMVEHRNIANRLEYTRRVLGFGPDDRTLQKTPVSFDVCVTEFFLPLLCGGAVVMARDERWLTPEYMITAIRRFRATYVHFVATMLQAFLRADGVEGVNGILRHIRCGGESLPEGLMEECLRKLDAGLYQSYGPAETAVAVTIWRCHTGHGYPKPPIGRPNANTLIHILNEYGLPVPPGVTGEVYIGGAQVGRGYLNNPGLTALKFVSDPISPSSGYRFYRTGDTARYAEDGNILFCGRVDGQVKIMGQRVEPTETAHRLRECPGVDQAVVLPEVAEGGACQLTAYLVTDSGFPGIPILREQLERSLPAYMIPSRFHRVDHIPVTRNGKTDPEALRKLVDRPAGVVSMTDKRPAQPLSPTEAELKAIWQQVIPGSDPSPNDHFLQCSGDSLKLLRLISLIEARWGRHLKTDDVFAHLRLSELAGLIDRSRVDGQALKGTWDVAPITVYRGTSGRKAFVMVGGGGSLEEYPKYHRLGEQSGLGFDWIVLPDPEAVGKEIPRTPLPSLAAAYAQCIRQRQPQGPWWLVGDCIAAYDLHATAYALEQVTGGQAHCILLDPVVPEGLVHASSANRDTATPIPPGRKGWLQPLLFRLCLHTGMYRWTLRHGFMAPRGEEQLRQLAEKAGLFDGAWYAGRHAEEGCTAETAFRHYLEQGHAKGYLPAPDFNAFRYSRACPDYIPGQQEPVTHALLQGFRHPATRRKVLALSRKGIDRKDISKARLHLRRSGFERVRISGDLVILASRSADTERLLNAWRACTDGKLHLMRAEGDHATYLREHLPATASLIATAMQDR